MRSDLPGAPQPSPHSPHSFPGLLWAPQHQIHTPLLPVASSGSWNEVRPPKKIHPLAEGVA